MHPVICRYPTGPDDYVIAGEVTAGDSRVTVVSLSLWCIAETFTAKKAGSVSVLWYQNHRRETFVPGLSLAQHGVSAHSVPLVPWKPSAPTTAILCPFTEITECRSSPIWPLTSLRISPNTHVQAKFRSACWTSACRPAPIQTISTTQPWFPCHSHRSWHRSHIITSDTDLRHPPGNRLSRVTSSPIQTLRVFWLNRISHFDVTQISRRWDSARGRPSVADCRTIYLESINLTIFSDGLQTAYFFNAFLLHPPVRYISLASAGFVHGVQNFRQLCAMKLQQSWKERGTGKL